MTMEVSLDYQTFWTYPRKRLGALAKSSECRSFMSRAVRQSAHEEICAFDCELPPDCNDNSIDCDHDDVQSASLVRRPDVLLRQKLVAEDLIARQQAATVGPAVEEAQSIDARASPQASDTDWFSTSRSASRSTPATFPDNDLPEDCGNDDPYPLDPALLGPPFDPATNDYTHIDLDIAPDTVNMGEVEERLASSDTPAVTSGDYASGSAVAGTELPKRAAKSLSWPGAYMESHEAVNSDKRLCKSMSPAYENTDVSYRAQDDVSRSPQEYNRDSQMVDDITASPPPKRVRLEGFSQEKDHLGERTSRSGSTGRSMRLENHTTTAAAGASTDDVHDEGAAKFEEWPLHNVLLKRVTSNGVATFQLQFDWNLCATHSQLGRAIPKQQRKRDNLSRPNVKADDPPTRAKYSADEDDFIISLKEELQLAWTEIHQEHANRFHFRSKESLQVRYCTKLKSRKSP